VEDYYGQPVDFIGLRGASLEAPLFQEVGAGHITIGSNGMPSLASPGGLCAKFSIGESLVADAIVDGAALVGDAPMVRGAFAFSSMDSIEPAIGEWGDVWTIGIRLFNFGLAGPPWGVMGISDDLCRAYQAEHGFGNAHAIEPNDMLDAVERCIPISNQHNYFCPWIWRRNGVCQLHLYERFTGVLLGSKTWTGDDVSLGYLKIGLVSFDSAQVALNQDIFITDFIIDKSSDTFPILDYIPTFDVDFNSQGGSAVDSQAIEAGGLVSTPTPPTRTGYTFGGWYRETGCTTAWVFATDTVSAATTLYAKWTINSFAVTFNSLGGSSVSGQTVNYGGLVSAPTAPTRDRYSFGGWYTEEACTTSWIFASDIITGARTLYAKWTLLSNRVTFDSQGGSAAHYEDVILGESIATIPVPSRIGFNFLGWFTQALGAGERILAATIPIADMTAYALWVPSNSPSGIGSIIFESGAFLDVNEGSSKAIVASFVDESGAAFIPSAIFWSLYNGQGEVINTRLNVPAAPASSVRIILSGDDNKSVARRAERVVVLRATYTGTDGVSATAVGECRYSVNNITGI
jgi:uncharacterized repeat protein (TIGR02543 family)